MQKNDLQAIIVDGDAEKTVLVAEKLGEALANRYRLSTSQIRNIFGTVRRIEMNWPEGELKDEEVREARQAQRELQLLKPKMAYQAQRERGRGVETLVSVLTDAIDMIEGDRTRFQNFVDFFEATLAYHKAKGGR
jgi:CRISPR-associated protein Csm2